MLGYADRYRHVLAHIFGLKALNFADIGKIMGSVEAMEKDYVSDDWSAATNLIQTELFCLGTVFLFDGFVCGYSGGKRER